MAKQMDRLHRDVQKRYHTLCNLLGLDSMAKEALLAPYGVSSSSDMETHDLVDVCGALDRELAARKGRASADLDKLRKQAMAAIGSWLKHIGQQGDIGYIKAIACRTTGHKTFNSIPPQRLRNIIGLYNNKVRDSVAVEKVSGEIGSKRKGGWIACVPSAGEA